MAPADNVLAVDFRSRQDNVAAEPDPKFPGSIGARQGPQEPLDTADNPAVLQPDGDLVRVALYPSASPPSFRSA
jgi:hypothetical protein